jgi:hypothetical protein
MSTSIHHPFSPHAVNFIVPSEHAHASDGRQIKQKDYKVREAVQNLDNPQQYR